MRLSLAAVATTAMLLLLSAGARPSVAQPFELQVEKDHLFGSSAGTLTFGADAVEYATDEEDDARVWVYRDIKQVQLLSPTQITLKTYEDQGWIRFGADRSFEFRVTEDEVPAGLADFLTVRIDRPLVLAVSPTVAGEPRYRVSVKLRQRVRGSDGVLAVYDGHIVYETDRVEHARHWRDLDLHSVFQPDRHRLTIEAYEGGGDDTRAFSFDLKEDLPAGFLDVLWRRLYRPSPARIGARADGTP